MSLPSWCPKYDSRKHDPKTGEEVYCICKKPDSGELMVGCDGCDDWFHFTCIKIPKNYRDLVFSFYCPYCAAGITGPALNNAGTLPRTLWKRKCRLPDCYRECAADGKSKYCSAKHGEEYMKSVINKLYLPGVSKLDLLRQLLQETQSLEEFKQMGHGNLPEVDRPLSKEEYERMVEDDKDLQELISERDELDSVRLPDINKHIEQLDKYLQWINEVNDQLFHLADQLPARKKSKSTSKVTLCGYNKSYKMPCSIEEFIEKYKLRRETDADQALIDGVCCKKRCGKHQDWIQLAQNELDQQKDSTENMKRRLDLLVKVRTNQLGILFFEQLASPKPIQRTGISRNTGEQKLTS